MPFLLLMPSFNQARYIGDAVRSVLAQDDRDWELWIVDNSTDSTPEVMRAFDDPRIRFHHIPRRMDPGTCLNWMLERARGDCFSYVHTDNNLRPGYVARMRRALAGRTRGLAYCDMGTLDGDGVATGVLARGAFGLARLFSLDPLGVPFAATTELARALGGFRANDLADDVRFCASAWGLAEYVHDPEPLVDYRVHGGSRWNLSGWPRIRQGFLDLFLELRPQVAERGAGDPLDALAGEVAKRFEELERPFHALWDERLARRMKPWWSTGSTSDALFHAGFLRLPGFTGDEPKPPLRWLLRDAPGRVAAWPWDVYATAADRTAHRSATWDRVRELHKYVAPWAWLATQGRGERFCVARPDLRSMVTARILELELGWQPAISAGAGFPRWCRWPAARGGEPRLHVEGQPRFDGA